MLDEHNFKNCDLNLRVFQKIISKMSDEELREVDQLNQNDQKQLQSLMLKKIIEELLILYINKNP